MPFDELTIAVVGARHPNKGPGNRETEILMLAPGDPVTIVPEPNNPADKDALAVYAPTGIQIGYILAVRTRLFRAAGDAGREARAIFQQRTAGGCLIRVSFDGNDPSLPPPADVFDQPDIVDRDVRDPGADDDGFYPDYIPPDD